jgi:hypothetical protein
VFCNYLSLLGEVVVQKDIYEEIGQCIWHRKWPELFKIFKEANGSLDLKRIINTPYPNCNILTGLFGVIVDFTADLETYKKAGDEESVAEREQGFVMIAALYRCLLENVKSIDANTIFPGTESLLLSELLRLNQLEVFNLLVKKLDGPVRVSLIDKKDMSNPQQAKKVKILLLLSDLYKNIPKKSLPVIPKDDYEEIRRNEYDDDEIQDKSYQRVKKPKVKTAQELEHENYYPELVETLKQIQMEIRFIFNNFSESTTSQGFHFFKGLNTDPKIAIALKLLRNRGFDDVPVQYLVEFIRATVNRFHSLCGQNAIKSVQELVIEEFMDSGMSKTAGITGQQQERYKNVVAKALQKHLDELRYLGLDRLRPKFLIDAKNELVSYASTAEDLRKQDVIAITAEVFGKIVNKAPRVPKLAIVVEDESMELRSLFGNN